MFFTNVNLLQFKKLKVFLMSVMICLVSVYLYGFILPVFLHVHCALFTSYLQWKSMVQSNIKSTVSMTLYSCKVCYTVHIHSGPVGNACFFIHVYSVLAEMGLSEFLLFLG